MSIVRYKRDDIQPITAEREAELRALAERPDSEIDLSDMPEQDELDFKYSIPATIYNVLSNSERSDLGRRLLAAEQVERATLKARHEAEHPIAEARQLAHQT